MSKKRSKARRPTRPAPQVPHAPVDVVGVDAVASCDEATDLAPAPVAGSAEASGPVVADQVTAPDSAPVSDDTAPPSDDTAQVDPATHAFRSSPVAMPGEPDQPAPSAAPVDLHAETARFAPFDDPDAIRGVLIQVAGGRLLLPNATIAEVLSYAEPEPVGGETPDWLLGRMRWRGWQLPLVALSQLAGVGTERTGLGTKVVVLKALGGQGRTPYFAILTQGFPRLVTVSERALAREDDEVLPRGIQARVRLNQDEALLPDLEAIEAFVLDALAQTA